MTTLKEKSQGWGQQILDFWPVIVFVISFVVLIGGIVMNAYVDGRIVVSKAVAAPHLIAFREEMRDEIADIKVDLGILKEAKEVSVARAERLEDKIDNVINILLERQ